MQDSNLFRSHLYPNSVRIGLMAPDIADTWAQRTLSDGTTTPAVKKGDTINHTTSQPIATGLFCQRIFGPCTDYTCACGHEKIRIHLNTNVSPPVCPECHVEWTESSVRRQRLGTIQLISPVTHKWFSDSRNYIPTLLGISVKTFRGLKECKLFFPFALNPVNTNKQQQTKELSVKRTSYSVNELKGSFQKRRAMSALKYLVESNKSTANSIYNLDKTNVSSLVDPLMVTRESKQGSALLNLDRTAPLPLDNKINYTINNNFAAKNTSKSKNLQNQLFKQIAFYSYIATTEILTKEITLTSESQNFISDLNLEKSWGFLNERKSSKTQNKQNKFFSLKSKNKKSNESENNNGLQVSSYSFGTRKIKKSKTSLVASYGPSLCFATKGHDPVPLVVSHKEEEYKKGSVVGVSTGFGIKPGLFNKGRNWAKPFSQKSEIKLKDKKTKDKTFFNDKGVSRLNNYGFSFSNLKEKKRLSITNLKFKKDNNITLNDPKLGFGSSYELFNGYHSFPVRPSFTQPEDYRRQFIKFLSSWSKGPLGVKKGGVLPIAKYVNQGSGFALLGGPALGSQPNAVLSPKEGSLEQKGQKRKEKRKEGLLRELNLNKITETESLYNPIVRAPQPSLEVYFSSAKSGVKEQTVKRILTQTGGGGLQHYLGLINLGQLVFLLQNDLSEIAPRLAKSHGALRVLLQILKDTKKDNSAIPENSIKTSAFGLSSRASTTSYASQRVGSKDHKKGLVGQKEQNQLKYKNLTKEYRAVKKICRDFQNRKNSHKRRFKLAFQLLRTMSNPTSMTMSSVPVLPPGLRPIIDVPKIGPITADLNIRYRGLIFALRNLRELAYVDFRNAGAAQASVQEAVDDLLYTGGKTRRDKQVRKTSTNLYKSLAMRLKGKHGRFRGNLLGKRVDYSGRSVIVVGPTLKIHQCGLPFEIAIKLFNPFLIRRLIQKGLCKNVYKAKQVLSLSKFKPLIWSLLREVMLEHLVLLNRAPTLHRLGVQAFMPILISGRAILLHPLVCTGFNADFDGDQMGVHVPLFPQARAEAWKMMWSRNNFLSTSSGEPILLPSQDMVLGCYYLTESGLEPFKKDKKKFYLTETQSNKIAANSFSTLQAQRPDDSMPLKNIDLNSQNNTLFSMKSVKVALNEYRRGLYSLQSIVWINPKQDLGYQRVQPKTSKNAIQFNQSFEHGDGSTTPTLELRVSPYGITRLLQTSGCQTSLFKNSILLPARSSVFTPTFEVSFVRTTIGRLLFDELLQKS